MRAIKVKRLIYSKLGNGELMYGGEEYDGRLTDDNILGAIHEVGKTEWRSSYWKGPGNNWANELWLLVPDENNPQVKYPMYRITVGEFYRYEKTWWDLLLDNIKRILRI